MHMVITSIEPDDGGELDDRWCVEYCGEQPEAAETLFGRLLSPAVCRIVIWLTVDNEGRLCLQASYAPGFHMGCDSLWTGCRRMPVFRETINSTYHAEVAKVRGCHDACNE